MLLSGRFPTVTMHPTEAQDFFSTSPLTFIISPDSPLWVQSVPHLQDMYNSSPCLIDFPANVTSVFLLIHLAGCFLLIRDP
jgi:hypothetical protein